jgi:hypothetical protein
MKLGQSAKTVFHASIHEYIIRSVMSSVESSINYFVSSDIHWTMWTQVFNSVNSTRRNVNR